MKAVKTKTPLGKGKGKEMQDKDFEEEKAWLLFKDIPVTQEVPIAGGSLQNQALGSTGNPMTDLSVPPEEGGLECGCCFSTAPFVCFPNRQYSELIN